MKNIALILSISLLSLITSADPVPSFVFEQNIFNNDGSAVQTTKDEKGSVLTDAKGKQRRITWEKKELETGLGYRVNQIEVNKMDKKIRIRAASYIGDDIRAVTECEGQLNIGIRMKKSESRCVVATRRVCERVLNAYEMTGGKPGKAKEKLDEIKKKIDQCEDTTMQYQRILAAYTSMNSGDLDALGVVLKSEKENIKNAIDGIDPGLGFDFVNEMSPAEIAPLTSRLTDASKAIGNASSEIVKEHARIHKYIALCEQNRNRFYKQNIPVGTVAPEAQKGAGNAEKQ